MQQAKLKVRVGMGGWQLVPFNGVFYPANSPRGFRKLQYYSKYFDTVEVNATFYTNTLTPRNAYQWMEDVSGNKDFVFSVKLYKGFTHSMDARHADVKNVHRLLEPMAAEGKLAGLIMQFPYSFYHDDERREHLTRLSKAFSPFRLFVELRHNSWNTADTLKFLQENNLHLVNVDLPRIKKHMALTDVAWGDAAYFRLMGRNAKAWDQPSPEARSASESGRYLYRYNDEELNQIGSLIKQATFKVEESEVILHNDPNGHSLLNGFQLRALLDPDRKVEVPQNLAAAFPQLKQFNTAVNPSPSLFDELSS